MATLGRGCAAVMGRRSAAKRQDAPVPSPVYREKRRHKLHLPKRCSVAQRQAVTALETEENGRAKAVMALETETDNKKSPGPPGLTFFGSMRAAALSLRLIGDREKNNPASTDKVKQG